MSSYCGEMEGTILAGRYWLERPLEADPGASRWLARDQSGGGRPVLVEILPESGRERLTHWSIGQSLDHPNLLRVLDAGECDGAVYAAMEAPDEVLSSLLRERVMDPEEARAVWSAVSSALRYLHSRGMVHGAVTPTNIMAAGEEIKLSPAAAHAKRYDADYQQDLRQLGLTVYETLTGRRDEAVRRLDTLPPDLADVIRTCLETEPAPQRKRFRFHPAHGIFAAGAVIAATIFLWNPAAPPPRTPAPASASPPAAAPKPVPRAAAPPQQQLPSPMPLPKARGEGRVWRVVVYTYSQEQPANAMAARLRERWPDSTPEVIRTSDGKNYFVSVGGLMTLKDAEQMRRQAWRHGMPRDSFVRNLGR